jgi:crossover junction endonuclease MUS81
MSIILKVDNREQKIKELLIENKINTNYIKYENLEYGDFIFEIEGDSSENPNVPLLIIERKSLSDLASSLRDTRYKNQKINLLNNFDRKVLYYIIEGDMNFDSNSQVSNYTNVSKGSLISCVINTMIRDDIKVFQTKNINDTFNLLNNIMNKLLKDLSKYTNKIDSSVPKTNFEIKKKSNMSKEECFKHQLSQIPGISLKSAEAITKQYSTMLIFYNELSNKSNEEKKNLLLTVYTVDDKEKKRKLSSKSIDNIINIMF